MKKRQECSSTFMKNFRWTLSIKKKNFFFCPFFLTGVKKFLYKNFFFYLVDKMFRLKKIQSHLIFHSPKRNVSQSLGSYLPGNFKFKDMESNQIESLFLIGKTDFLFSPKECQEKKISLHSIGIKKLFSIMKNQKLNIDLQRRLLGLITSGIVCGISLYLQLDVLTGFAGVVFGWRLFNLMWIEDFYSSNEAREKLESGIVDNL